MHYHMHLAPALVQVFLHAPGPVVGVGVIPRTWPQRWCRCFCKHLALALVQALLQALGPRIGAGVIAGTWPQHWCRRYCRHPAPVLVQALLQAPGPRIGAGVTAGTRQCNHDGDNACTHTFHSYLPFMQPKWLRLMHAIWRILHGYMHVTM